VALAERVGGRHLRPTMIDRSSLTSANECRVAHVRGNRPIRKVAKNGRPCPMYSEMRRPFIKAVFPDQAGSKNNSGSG